MTTKKHKIASALLSLCMLTGACAVLNKLKSTPINVPVLLDYAQYGIDADCKFGAGALAVDVCTFGTDTIALAKSKDPKDVKKLLQDAEVTQPKIAPYIDWLVALL